MPDAMIIDLDLDPPPPDADPTARRRSPRRLPVIVVAALCLAVLGGVEPVPPGVVALLAIPIEERPVIGLSADTIVVAEGADSTGGRAPSGEVSDYALPSGALRWRRLLPRPVVDLSVLPGAGVVLAFGEEPSSGRTFATALDAGDGRTLWSSGSVVVLDVTVDSPDGLLLDLPDTGTGGDSTAGGGATPAAGTGTIRWADLRTGRPIWSRPWSVLDGVQVGVDVWPPDPRKLLLVAPDGTVDVVVEHTGAVVASGRLDLAGMTSGRDDESGQNGGQNGQADPAVGDGLAQAVVAGNRIVLYRPPGGGVPGALMGFDATTLDPQWTVEEDSEGFLASCRPMVCMSGDSLVVVDPVTGTAWRSRRWLSAVSLDDTHLIVSSVAGTYAVVDARTGRLVLDLTNWDPVYEIGTGRLRLLLSTRLQPYGGFWYATVGAGQSGVRPLGYVPAAIFGGCESAGDLLACQTQHGIVQVWRYRT
jgi:hypothetical protein